MNRTLYINITEQSIALLLIAKSINIDVYRLFLLYETFGDDMFLFLELFKDNLALSGLTEFRLRRCFQYAHTLVPVLLGSSIDKLSVTELRAYKQIHPLLFETKLKITGDSK